MSILLPGSPPPRPPARYPIYARSGWEIPQPDEDIRRLSLEEARIKARERLSWTPGLTLRSVSPHTYNCVGMIFASRRAWIEIDHIYAILREDGYHRIQRNEVVAGDIVLYVNNSEPSHVALVVDARPIHPTSQSLTIRVLSKWGFEAEYEHFVENVDPRLGTPDEFYTERQS